MKKERCSKKGIKQMQTPCTRKIQKTILKNMAKTARYRINKSRAEKSVKLLTIIFDSKK